MQIETRLPEPLAYSVDDASRACAICRTNLFKAIKDGKLIARKAGKKTIVLRRDLESYLASLEIAGAQLAKREAA